MANSFDELYDTVGHKYDIDPVRLKAHAIQESGEQPAIKGTADNRGSLGIGQFIPETWQRIMPGVPLSARIDPATSIEAMGRLIAENDARHTDASGNVDVLASTAAYNGSGPAADRYAEAVRGHHQKLTAAGGLKLTTREAPDSDPFGQTLKAGPAADATTPATPSTPEGEDAFGATLKAGPPGASKAVDPAATKISVGIGPDGAPTAPVSTPVEQRIGTGEPIADAGTDIYGRSNDSIVTAPGRVIGEGLRGAKEGFGSGDIGLSPESENMLQRAGIYNGPNEYNPLKGLNRALIGGGAAAGDLLLRGGNALLRGGQAAIAQTGVEAGAPQLGRDLAALPEAFPTGDFSAGGTRLPAPAAPAENMLAARQAELARIGDNHTMSLEAPLPGAFRDNPGVTAPSLPAGPAEANPLVPAVNRLAAPPEATAPPTGGGQQPAPNAAGAQATPTSLAGMTPKEVQAYRSTAEGSKLIESQQPGQADTNAYVPGVAASTAEVEQTVNAARDAKAANMAHPAVSQAAREQADANNAARTQHFDNTIKSPVDVNNAKEARAAQAETDLAATWKSKTDANAQPVIDVANEIKKSNDGRRPLVRNAVDSVTGELFDADGKMITDPELLYGVRKHLDDLLSKEAGAADPKSVRAAASLQQLKTSLDGVIETAAPGFKQYLKNFADASKPIDEMEVLQGHKNGLYDTQGRMQLSRVQTMMRNIIDSRASPGINPYKSISDETMQKLWGLRDDLRRSASAQELARTPGSDTAQNMLDLAKRGAVGTVRLAAHGAANYFAPVLGSMAVNAADAGLVNRLAARANRKGVAAGMSNLNPNRLRPQQPD